MLLLKILRLVAATRLWPELASRWRVPITPGQRTLNLPFALWFVPFWNLSQPTGLYGSDRHSIGLLPKRFISKQSPCGCVLRIVELTLIRSELSALDMP